MPHSNDVLAWRIRHRQRAHAIASKRHARSALSAALRHRAIFAVAWEVATVKYDRLVIVIGLRFRIAQCDRNSQNSAQFVRTPLSVCKKSHVFRSTSHTAFSFRNDSSIDAMHSIRLCDRQTAHAHSREREDPRDGRKIDAHTRRRNAHAFADAVFASRDEGLLMRSACIASTGPSSNDPDAARFRGDACALDRRSRCARRKRHRPHRCGR